MRDLHITIRQDAYRFFLEIGCPVHGSLVENFNRKAFPEYPLETFVARILKSHMELHEGMD